MELIKKFIKARGKRADDIQIKEWIRLAQAGDMRARNYVIEHNLELVMREAFRTRIYIDDVFQQGIFGVIRAVELFDLSSGNAFSTYAIPWIKSFMQRYINNMKHPIRKPVYLDEIHKRYFRLVEEFPNKSQEFYIEKLMEEKGMKKVSIINALKFISDKYSSKDAIESAYDGESIDFGIIDDEMDDVKYNILEMDEIFHILDQRETWIVKYKFQGWTYRTIGLELGISHERVRQVYEKAMSRLKAAMWALDRGFIVKPLKTIEKVKGRKKGGT